MKRIAFYVAITAIMVLAAGIFYQAIALHRLKQHDEAIRTLLKGQDVPLAERIDALPRLHLARAIYLHGKKRHDEALETVNLILDRGDARFRAKVRYNLGNIYLTQAMERVDKFSIDQALPLVELSKDAYREALRLDSGYWDAKYNLEVAMRLMPEMDRMTKESASEDKQQEKLWTTVPGFPRGLP